MKPQSSQKQPDDSAIVSASRLERMSVPLTVLHANIQLLRRRVHTGKMPDPASLLRVLDKMEQASRTLTSEFRQLDQTISTPRAIHEKMDGNDPGIADEERERKA